MRKYRSVLVTLAVLMVLGTAGAFYVQILRGDSARPSEGLEILSQIPIGAPTLIYIDLAAIRTSSFYQNRPDHSALTVPDSDYSKFVQATGFDFEKDLDKVAIASWPESLAQGQRKMIAVAEGRFDRQKIRDYAMKNGKLDRQQGHDVFLFPAHKLTGANSNPNPAEPIWNSLLFLDDHRIAILEGPSIAPLLAPNATDSQTDPVRERAARVTGAAAFIVSRVPAIPDNFAPGGMQSAQFTGLIRSVKWITLAARPDGENLRVSLEGECQTSTDARQLQSALEMLRLFGRAGLENPKTRQSMDPATLGVLETLLKSADITQTGESVRILVEITPDILKVSGAQKKQ